MPNQTLYTHKKKSSECSIEHLAELKLFGCDAAQGVPGEYMPRIELGTDGAFFGRLAPLKFVENSATRQAKHQNVRMAL